MTSIKSDFQHIDRQPFYGSKLPPSIAALRKLQTKIDRSVFQKLIRMTVSYLEGKLVQSTMFENVTSANLPKETVCIAYTGILKILQAAFRCSTASLTKEQFLQDISVVGLPKEIMDDLASAAFGSRRQVLERAIISSKPELPKVNDVKWKIDVAISTTALNRVLEPVVSMQLTLSNGDIKRFEMSVSKFQELRYNVASVLKEMEELENRSVLKIQD